MRICLLLVALCELGNIYTPTPVGMTHAQRWRPTERREIAVNDGGGEKPRRVKSEAMDKTMTRIMKTRLHHGALWGRIAIYCLALSMLGACATRREVISVAAPSATNPPSGEVVRIDSVIDGRRFLDHSIWRQFPSRDSKGTKPIPDKARVVARLISMNEGVQAEVVLEEGQSVTSLAEQVVTTALRQSGYVVAQKGDASYETAVPLNVHVKEFWAWMGKPGWTSAPIHQRAAIEVEGAIVGTTGRGTAAEELTLHAFTPSFEDAFQKGLIALLEETARLLRPPK